MTEPLTRQISKCSQASWSLMQFQGFQDSARGRARRGLYMVRGGCYSRVPGPAGPSTGLPLNSLDLHQAACRWGLFSMKKGRTSESFQVVVRPKMAQIPDLPPVLSLLFALWLEGLSWLTYPSGCILVGCSM